LFRLFLLLVGDYWYVQQIAGACTCLWFHSSRLFFVTFGINVLMVCWCRETGLWSKQSCVFCLEDEVVLWLAIMLIYICYVFWVV